jgi:putative ABC transport system substrate-binding protein
MRRREFVAALVLSACGLASPCPLRAQAKMLRVGVVSPAVARTAPVWAAFEQRLRELGYVEPQNLVVDFLNAPLDVEHDTEAMQELVRRKVDVIIAAGPEIALKSAVAATSSLPIVMLAIDYDPVARGYVASLARPAGNVTGVFFQQIELSAKRLQLVRDAFPQAQGAAVLWDAAAADQWQATQNAAATLGLRLTGIELRAPPYDYERALTQAAAVDGGILIVLASPVFFSDRERLTEIALRHRMASMFVFREWADVGGLLSYGPCINGLFRRAADYVDRIARGTRPADLPIEQPTKFELVVNLRTARAIEVTIPSAILLRADEVIE